MALRCPPIRPGRAILTGRQAREIARLAASGILLSDLAEMYGVSVVTISNIANGRTWARETGASPNPRVRRLDDSQRGEIVRLRDAGLTGAEIAAAMECSEATVSRILAQSRAAGE